MNFKKVLVSLLLIATVMGSVVQPVSAAGTIYVGTTDTNEAVTYDSIGNAVENASDGDTIEVAVGTYNESIETNTSNLTIQRYDSATEGTVEIDASGEKYGDAFFGENVELGANVNVVENIVIVNESNADVEGTYGTIQNAVDNSSDNTTVSIVPGEYNESINVTSQYIGFVNDEPESGNVTIDATNTSSGNAFTGEYSDSIRVGADVTVKNSVLGIGGGAVESAVAVTFLGIPVWAFAVVALLVGYVYYEEKA